MKNANVDGETIDKYLATILIRNSDLFENLFLKYIFYVLV